MKQEKTRQKAIELYNSGMSVTEICKLLKTSRKWFYKWERRYDRDPKGEWYKDHSKAPKHFPGKKITALLEQQILSIREHLEHEKYAQKGAISIQYEFYRQKKKVPPVWTINRVLKKYGLVRKKDKKYQSKNLPYPGAKYISVHQMDFVGPRYIKDYGRVYSLNIIDIETHYVQINPLPGKGMNDVLLSIIRFWKQYGFPDFLQMDNELSFRGSNRYPRSFGKLIRFVLSQNVGIIFTPMSEPWRNGIIENFNNKFDKMFYRRNVFTDLADMKKKHMNLKTTITEITDTQQTTAELLSNTENYLVIILSLMMNMCYQIKFLWKKEKLLSYVLLEAI